MNTARKNLILAQIFKLVFVVTKNIKIGVQPAAPVKNWHKMHYHREFTCKRDITLANPRHKIGCSLGVQVPFVNFFAANIFYYS